MREVSYQPRHIKKYWRSHVFGFLRSRGFQVRVVQPEFVDFDTFYIRCYEYQIDEGDLTAHAVVSKGYEVIHDPSKVIQKNITPRECKITYGKEYYLEIKHEEI